MYFNRTVEAWIVPKFPNLGNSRSVVLKPIEGPSLESDDGAGSDDDEDDAVWDAAGLSSELISQKLFENFEICSLVKYKNNLCKYMVCNRCMVYSCKNFFVTTNKLCLVFLSIISMLDVL